MQMTRKLEKANIKICLNEKVLFTHAIHMIFIWPGYFLNSVKIVRRYAVFMVFKTENYSMFIYELKYYFF